MDRDFLKYIKDRIKNDPDLSQAGLANELNKTPATVSRLLNGDVEHFQKYLPGIRRYIGESANPDDTAMLLIDEIEFKGKNSFDDPRVLSQWALPLRLFDLPAPIDSRKVAKYIKAVPVRDNTNSPVFKTGDYVFVYTLDKEAAMGASYLIWDGRSSFIIRQCEPVPNTKPAKIRLKPFNGQYDIHEITYKKEIFIGRVVGHYRKPLAL